MRKFLFSFGLVLLAAQNTFAQFTLEKLLSGETELQELVRSNISVESLVTEFENRLDLSKSEIHRFLSHKKNKALLKALEKQEKELIRDLKRKPRAARNKCFYGNPDEAVDATADQLEMYPTILAEAERLLGTGEINKATYDEAKNIIETLQNLHANNRKITEEFSIDPISHTYGNKIHIHPETTDVPFELKAGILFDILTKGYAFAEKNNLLPAFFTDGLSRSSGCIEARLTTLGKWHEDRQRYISSLSELSKEEQAQRLPDTAQSIILKILAENYDQYSERVENRSMRRTLAHEVSSQYAGLRDISGNIITPEMVNQSLKELYLITSHSPPMSPKTNRKELNSIQYFILDGDNTLTNAIIYAKPEEKTEKKTLNNRGLNVNSSIEVITHI